MGFSGSSLISKIGHNTNLDTTRIWTQHEFGHNTNKGLRLDRYGRLLRTRDEFGNLIPDTHNTGEKLNE